MKEVSFIFLALLVISVNTRRFNIDLAIESYPTTNVCKIEQHYSDGKCVSNKDYCSKYDVLNNNCSSCKWYAWKVENKTSKSSSTSKQTGTYCEPRWWLWILLIT